MRRRAFLNVLGSAVAWPLAGRAQPGKVHLILWVSTEAQPDPFIAGFREGMRERGYVEGQNLAFVLRYAPGDPAAVRAMLPELLTIPADLIVSSGPAIQAMRATTGQARPVRRQRRSGRARHRAEPSPSWTELHRKHIPVARGGAKAGSAAA